MNRRSFLKRAVPAAAVAAVPLGGAAVMAVSVSAPKATTATAFLDRIYEEHLTLHKSAPVAIFVSKDLAARYAEECGQKDVWTLVYRDARVKGVAKHKPDEFYTVTVR